MEKDPSCLDSLGGVSTGGRCWRRDVWLIWFQLSVANGSWRWRREGGRRRQGNEYERGDGSQRNIGARDRCSWARLEYGNQVGEVAVFNGNEVSE